MIHRFFSKEKRACQRTVGKCDYTFFGEAPRNESYMRMYIILAVYTVHHAHHMTCISYQTLAVGRLDTAVLNYNL